MIAESTLIDKSKKMIKSGDFEFHVVRDGHYRLDGGAMYGMVPKPIWDKIDPHDEKNRLYMSLNCLVAKRGEQVFLVDAGIGNKLDEKGKEIFGIEREKTLIEELEQAGIKPEDITHIILTHMHFDHTGWLTGKDGKLTFPNARYYVQKEEWEEAFKPHVRFKNSYLIPYYEALKGSNNIVLLNGNVDIDSGVRVLHVPGHSKGHQVALFDSGDRKVAHMGDIIAIATLVRQNWACGYDRDPEATITNKEKILDTAYKENWIIITAHDKVISAGEIEMVKEKYRLKKLF